MDYQQAGVDIRTSQSLMDWLKQEALPDERLVSGIGGFSAIFRAKFSKKMSSPCLVSSTDGVGTKVLVASHFGQFQGIGQDLVAMCVNDLLCCGAQPLFFLDYYAVGKLDLESAKSFLKGVRTACIASHCVLIGGETAEMPGVYQKKDFDCAGFVVGVVDEKAILGSHRVQVGDRLMGFSSSGFHSNGFSLLRQVFAKDIDNWQKELTTPTKLYAKPLQELLKDQGIHALAHLTGGGVDNLCRVMPSYTRARLKAWEIPECFLEVQRRAHLTLDSLFKIFNCGIGMIAIVEDSSWKPIFEKARQLDLSPMDLGSIEHSSQITPHWVFQEVDI